MYGQFRSAKFQTFLLYILEHLIIGEDHVLHLTVVLEDWEHWRIIASDGVLSAYLTSYVLQLYVLFIVARRTLSTVPDIPCQPGFNNSLDYRDCL